MLVNGFVLGAVTMVGVTDVVVLAGFGVAGPSDNVAEVGVELVAQRKMTREDRALGE